MGTRVNCERWNEKKQFWEPTTLEVQLDEPETSGRRFWFSDETEKGKDGPSYRFTSLQAVEFVGAIARAMDGVEDD